MQNFRFISRQESELAAQVQPKKVKQELLNELGLDASYPDVFHQTEYDNDGYILSSEDDIVIIDLPEHSTSGFAWTELPQNENLRALFNMHISPNDQSIGGLSRRKIVVQGSAVAEIHTQERRPWEVKKDALHQFGITLDFRGKESGLPRAFNQ